MNLQLDFVIPPSISFDSLDLKQDEYGQIELDWRPVAAVCITSGIDPDFVSSRAPAVCLPMLLEGWLTVQSEAGLVPPHVGAAAAQIIALMHQEAVRANGPEPGCEVRVRAMPASALH